MEQQKKRNYISRYSPLYVFQLEQSALECNPVYLSALDWSVLVYSSALRGALRVHGSALECHAHHTLLGTSQSKCRIWPDWMQSRSDTYFKEALALQAATARRSPDGHPHQQRSKLCGTPGTTTNKSVSENSRSDFSIYIITDSHAAVVAVLITAKMTTLPG